MQSHHRNGMQQRDGDYGHEDFDEYEEEASEIEEEDGRFEATSCKDQQPILDYREQLKENYRQVMRKENAGILGLSSPSQGRASVDSKIGYFFGPSQTVIASRVIDESRSLRETQHIVSKKTKARVSSSSEIRTHVQFQKSRVVNEIKKKAELLKGMRDYEFLHDDAADFPTPKEQQSVCKKVSAPSADYRSAQAHSRSHTPVKKPARPASNENDVNNLLKNTHALSKLGPVKGAAGNRPKPFSTEPRKVVGASAGAGHRKVSMGHKALHPRVPGQALGTSKPPARVTNDQSLKKKPSLSTVPHSSPENLRSQQKRLTQILDKTKIAPKKPMPQASKQIPPRSTHEDRLRKPVKRKIDEGEDRYADVSTMIRNMFGYNPNRYAGFDEDVSDMEADFEEIQREERRSSKIAKKEDEEQLRLIEEEEKRERMRRKQKHSRG